MYALKGLDVYSLWHGLRLKASAVTHRVYFRGTLFSRKFLTGCNRLVVLVI